MFDYKFKDGILDLQIDSNEDGEPVLKLKLNSSEALQEAIKRGSPVEGVKLVDFSFSGSKIKIWLDTDKDGENLMELEIDLMEAFDELT